MNSTLIPDNENQSNDLNSTTGSFNSEEIVKLKIKNESGDSSIETKINKRRSSVSSSSVTSAASLSSHNNESSTTSSTNNNVVMFDEQAIAPKL